MKIAIVGASGHYRYVLDALAENELVGIAAGVPGEDLTKLRKALAERGIEAKVFADRRELIPLAEVAVVNTRFDQNAPVAGEFLKADKFVFSEKPLGTTEEQLAELKKINDASRAFVCGMFGIRYAPWFLTIRKHLPEIGELRLLSAQKSYKLGKRADFYHKRETFGGILPWVAIHGIDWILTLLGGDPVDGVTAYQRPGEGGSELELCAFMLLHTKSGVLASVSSDYYRPKGAPTHDDDRLRVVGTKGILEAAGGVVTLLTEGGAETLPLEPGEDVFRLFLRRCRGENVGVTPEESFYATEIALSARNAADAAL